MSSLFSGYLYSLSPIHCGGEGDIGNILEIAREVHTNFPYIPASSLRGSVRNEVEQLYGTETANKLFGKELDDSGQMGVHQIWFGDARLLWVPMRTMARRTGNRDAFSWVSCHTLVRDHALFTHKHFATFPDHAVGTSTGTYLVADAEIRVEELNEHQKKAVTLDGTWSSNLYSSVKSVWEENRIVLPDDDFQILMEHALWTQIRNKIQDSGGAEVFWTDVCIPRDTIFYYPWGYTPSLKDELKLTKEDWNKLTTIISGLIQVGGQASIGRGWVQSWATKIDFPDKNQINDRELVETEV